MLGIAILSFNRAHYLEQVLESLRPQLDKDTPVFLFQDGALCKESNVRYAPDGDIQESIHVYNKIIGQELIVQPHNLGTGMHFDFVENFMFLEQGFEEVLFMEDDAVLSPFYIRAIKGLLDAHRENQNIGIMSAFGPEPAWSIESQRESRDRYALMGHHWAFATTRDSWKNRKPLVDDYIDIIRGADYRLRDRMAIRRWQEMMGVDRKNITSSQDAAKAVAMCRAGQVKITTCVTLAKYIGMVGANFNPAIYKKMKYADAQMYPDEWYDFPELDYMRAKEIYAEQQAKIGMR